MPDIIQRLNIVHEASFASPAFALLREFSPIIKIFYEILSTRFSLNTEHITINPTTVVSDLVIHFGLFNNVASIELRPDKMSVRLPNITNIESVEIAKQTIAQAHAALEKALPEIALNGTSFSVNVWVALEGGAEAADQLFDRHAKPAAPLDVSLWGGDSIRYSVRNYSRNEAEGWDVAILAEPSLAPGSHIFFSIDLTVPRQGLRPIGEQIALAESKLPLIFAAFGLNMASDNTNAQ